jgi:hypothetical protein
MPADITYPTDLTFKKKPRSRKTNAAILRQLDYLQRNLAAIAIVALIFTSKAFQR